MFRMSPFCYKCSSSPWHVFLALLMVLSNLYFLLMWFSLFAISFNDNVYMFFPSLDSEDTLEYNVLGSSFAFIHISGGMDTCVVWVWSVLWVPELQSQLKETVIIFPGRHSTSCKSRAHIPRCPSPPACLLILKTPHCLSYCHFAVW